jgi:hypothetical protein
MFTWICPQCGREVPPAYDECPDCSAKTKGDATPVAAAPAAAVPVAAVPAAPIATAPMPPAPMASAEAPAAPAPAAGVPRVVTSPLFAAPEQVRVRPYTAPGAPASAGAGLPTWLMAIVFAFAFVGLGAAIYWTAGYFRGSGAKPAASVESPAAKPGAPVNPYQKYIEVSGVRFQEDAKNKAKTVVKFILINHSPADVQGLGGNVTVWGRTQKSEEEAAGTFTFTTNVGPFQSKELEAPLNTKLKIYELPDWQNVSTDVQITAPSGG